MRIARRAARVRNIHIAVRWEDSSAEQYKGMARTFIVGIQQSLAFSGRYVVMVVSAQARPGGRHAKPTVKFPATNQTRAT